MIDLMLKRMSPYYFLFLFSIGFSMAGMSQDLGPGVLLDSVFCKSAPEQSYALYLPQSWAADKYFPIIYFFEPGARGKLPVEKYRDIADSHEIILVGSNNSRNGSWDVAFAAANAMFADTWSRLVIDSNQVYACGFSGGARVATAIAIETGKIKGVIGCGAGFPVLEKWRPKPGIQFPFVGIVGRKDMNWLEMHDTERLLSAMEIPNRLIPYDALHQWPDPELIAQGLDFLFLETLGKEALQMSREWAMARQMHRWQVAGAFEEIGEDYIAFYQWKNVKSDFGWLNQEGSGRDAGDHFRKSLKYEAGILEVERKRRDAINKHFLFNLDNYQDSSVFNWWELEGKSLTRQRNSKEQSQADMALRLTRMISARAIESPILLSDYAKTASLFKVWALVEPKAVWPHYRLAIAYAGLKEDRLAMAALKQAIKNGLTRKSRLNEPAEFDQLRKKKKFAKLLRELD